MKNAVKDLTRGSLWSGIFLFSFPLILSNLLQILFNMSDIAVVGRFAGSIALGAVGSTTTLVTLFTSFLIGIGGGVNVVTAQAFGRGEREDVRKTVHTAFLLCLAIGIGVLLFGELTSRLILTLLKTKEELIDGASLYLRIYFLGMPALAIFNYGNAVFSAAGDTKKPLLFLSIAGVLNVILNLFFVIVLKIDVAGVAIASISAQYLSAFAIMLALIRMKGITAFASNISGLTGGRRKPCCRCAFRPAYRMPFSRWPTSLCSWASTASAPPWWRVMLPPRMQTAWPMM